MIRKVLSFLFISLACAAFASDKGLPRPEGPVVLTVSGAIGVTNAEGRAEFDRAMLQALEWREIETYTSFTKGPQRFSGPTLVSVLEAVAAKDAELTMTALNDYAVSFPAAMAADHDVLLAMDHNGKPMRIRDKGPIWIVFPLTEAEAAEAPFDNQMVWQLARMHVGP